MTTVSDKQLLKNLLWGLGVNINDDDLYNMTPSDMEKIGRDFLRQIQFHKGRIEEIYKIKNKLPEPYITWICNILANGSIK
jgi:hypothetical protein